MYSTPRHAQRGFTIVELMVTIVLFSILMALAMPSFSTWIRNNKIRTVSDSLQSGLRNAQSEALRRSRQTVFSLTNDKPVSATYTATADGTNWGVNTVAATGMTGDPSVFVQSGVLTDVGSGVQITGPAAICFNAIGRMVANASPGVTGANCALPTNNPPVHAYNITFADAVAGVDRPLRVLVALGGQVRLCDPAKTLSDANPDGCP